MMVLLVTLWQLAKARRRWIGRRTDLANMVTAFSLSVVTYMTTGIFLHLSYARYFWLIMALAGAAAYMALREPDPEVDAETGPPGRPSRGAMSRSRIRPDGRAQRARLAVLALGTAVLLAGVGWLAWSVARAPDTGPAETDGPIPSAAAAGLPNFRHVYVVMLENHSFERRHRRPGRSVPQQPARPRRARDPVVRARPPLPAELPGAVRRGDAQRPGQPPPRLPGADAGRPAGGARADLAGVRRERPGRLLHRRDRQGRTRRVRAPTPASTSRQSRSARSPGDPARCANITDFSHFSTGAADVQPDRAEPVPRHARLPGRRPATPSWRGSSRGSSTPPTGGRTTSW